MKICKIEISNYRGIRDTQTIPLGSFSAVVGQNDSGKSIILNAIGSFLNPKEHPITESDFNDRGKPIEITCSFKDENLASLLESSIKGNIKKSEGLDEFIADLTPKGHITIKRTVSSPKKAFDSDEVLMSDYEPEDFVFLYRKSDEELTSILEAFSITIPVEGKGRNSKLEKIKHIKDYCESQRIQRKSRFIDDNYKIGKILPEVELFKADYGLEADTKFKSNSVGEIVDYLDKESSEEQKLAIVEQEIVSEMQKEAQSVKGYMDDYVSNLNKVEIKPLISWKDAIKSVDVSFQFDGDSHPIPMSHKGAGYRRLFMVARFRYLAERSKGKDVIYLIEEPETFLHPSAQQDLINALRDLAEDNQIVITTHSPVFAGATNIESAILCKKENGSRYEHTDTAGKMSLIAGIVEQLGIKPSYNLRDQHEKIVFVESHNDAKFCDLVCKNLIGSPLLSDPKVLVLPFGGGEDIDSFINIDYFGRSGRSLFLIIDSDKHQNNSDKQEDRAANFRETQKDGRAYVLQRSCLENYYHPRAFERVYGLSEDSFPSIDEKDNARNVIKKYKTAQGSSLNIKEKNNFDVLEAMTKPEWEEMVEAELVQEMREILG